MKLGIDVHYGCPWKENAQNKYKFNFDIDGETTLTGLIAEINQSGFTGNIDRFLKIPGSDRKFQTIYVNAENLDLPIAQLGFQDNANYILIFFKK